MRTYQWVTLLVGLVGFTLLARVYHPVETPPFPAYDHIFAPERSSSQLKSIEPIVLEESNSSISRSLPEGARIQAYSCGGKWCKTGTPLAPEPIPEPSWGNKYVRSSSSWK